MAFLTNLAPPILPDSFPSFPLNSGMIIIPYSISEYNKITDIKYVQLSLVHAQTRQTVLYQQNFFKSVNGKSILLLPAQDIVKYVKTFSLEEFEVRHELKVNQWYQVQLRFFSNLAADLPAETDALADFIKSKLPYVDENIVAFGSTEYWGPVLQGQIKALLQNLIPTTEMQQQFKDVFAAEELNNYPILQQCSSIVQYMKRLFNVGLTTEEWLSNNLQYASDWSKTLLIKGISPFKEINNEDIQIQQITEQGTYLRLGIYEIPQPLSKVTIKYAFRDSEEEEKIQNGTLSLSVGGIQTQFTNFISQSSIGGDGQNGYYISYQLPVKYGYIDDAIYTFKFNYKTTYNYTNAQTYKFKINLNSQEPVIQPLQCDITTIADKNFGRIGLNIAETDYLYFAANDINIYEIWRTSSETNFIKQELMQTWRLKPIQHNRIFIWYDTSIQNGIFYKYKFCRRSIQTSARQTALTDSIMCCFDDCFLIDQQYQLNIKLNPNISSTQYNKAEGSQTTIGSQYPAAFYNGAQNYKIFTINGLISSTLEQISDFSSDLHQEIDFLPFFDSTFNGDIDATIHQKLFTIDQVAASCNDFIAPYEKYLNLQNTHSAVQKNTNYSDQYIFEQEFRERVMTFLRQKPIKLFKSLTEGNLIIILSNISIQPLNTLGRKLYSFSATATEIAKCNLINLKKYHLINNKCYIGPQELDASGIQLQYFLNQQSLIPMLFLSKQNAICPLINSIYCFDMLYTQTQPPKIIAHIKTTKKEEQSISFIAGENTIEDVLSQNEFIEDFFIQNSSMPDQYISTCKLIYYGFSEAI